MSAFIHVGRDNNGVTPRSNAVVGSLFSDRGGLMVRSQVLYST